MKELVSDKTHLAWIRTLPCAVTGSRVGVEAAHLRKGSGAGRNQKNDRYVLPLNSFEHKKQHQEGEITFWNRNGGLASARELSSELYDISGDTETALKLLREFRFSI